MNLNLKGKKALVSGGSSGIGLAIKQALENEGVEVISWSRSEGVDLMKITPEFLRKFPDVDFLINNVGGIGSDPSEWKLAMEKNYNIMVELTNAYLMKKPNFGRVITIASMYGKEKGPSPGFTAANSAQIAYMKSLAGTINGITFNTIAPGYIHTKPEIWRYAKEVNAPIGEPEDVANIVTFLCSDKAKHLNGSLITVDGGFTHSF